MRNNTAPHILPTASNLLGFAFIALTSIKGFGVPQVLFVDKLMAVLIATLAASCVLSFISIRLEHKPDGALYENLADYLFIASLGMVVVFTGLLVFDLFFVIS